MSATLRANWSSASGVDLRCVITDTSGEVFYITGEAMEAWGGGAGRDADDYDIEGTAYQGYWLFTIPSTLPAGMDYTAQFYEAAAATIVDGDCEYAVASQDFAWDGSSMIDPTIATSSYLVTLTIRTTAEVAISGVRVYLSLNGSPANPTSITQVTNGSGQVTFWLEYTTYYIHCLLAGHSFAAASMTPASGSVSFTKDIGTLLVVGTAGDYTGAYLVRLLSETRTYAGEPSINKKYSDDWIINRAENNYAMILMEKNNMLQDPVLMRVPITVDGSDYYILPSTMGTVHAVYYDLGSGVKMFYRRRGNYNNQGKGVWVEGNMIRLQSADIVATGETLTVEAEPTGLARLHCGTCTVDADGTTVTLGASPYLGTLDNQINAYLGSVLRIIKVTGTSPTGNYIQERIISAYDATTREATVEVALDPIPAAGAGGYIYYEIAPQIPIGLDTVVAQHVAWELTSAEGLTAKAKTLLFMYQKNLRALRLEAFSKQLQSATVADDDTMQSSLLSSSLYG